MTVRTPAASSISTATPGQPQVDSLANVHPLAQVVGDVHVQGNAAIALGVSVRADQGANFWIGSGSILQEGVAIYGLSQGKVLGEDQAPYTIWLGEQVVLTHKVLIQGPAYLGSGCFVGFRSTLFNARLGQGCVVMMHALVQDVEIPPGKFVASGSVITRQEQADRLPDVSPTDMALVRELLGQDRTPISISSRPPQDRSVTESNESDGLTTMERQQLTPDVVQRVRQYLAQGLHIGTEHADSRRYRSGVWQTCSPINASREAEALGSLETCLAEHAGEYVRIFGIEPRAKQRVAPVTIQRPDGRPMEVTGSLGVAPHSSGGSGYQPAPSTAAPRGVLAPEVVQQVRQYLSQGYRIGSEHADSRRYRSNVWQTCSPIEGAREADVLAGLERCLAEHSGEYVRLFGINPQGKQRVAPITIQRPDDQPIQVSAAAVPISPPAHSNGNGQAQHLSGDWTQQVRQLIQQGYKVGAEHVDERRYRSNVWQTCPVISSTREGEVIAAIQACVAKHPGEYVRILGIDSVAKRRVASIVIQRPGAAPGSGATMPAPSAPSASFSAPAPTPGSAHHNGSASGQPLSQDVVQQVNQLVNQGFRVSLEHADQRRYHSGAWQTGGALDGSRVSDILAALERQLQAHQGEYVRLIGIDPRVKRRVLETTIQRP